MSFLRLNSVSDTVSNSDSDTIEDLSEYVSVLEQSLDPLCTKHMQEGPITRDFDF